MNSQVRGATVEVLCKCCKQPFIARVADRKRGWGKFCSKSCKAVKQEARTGQHKAYLQGCGSSHTENRYDEDEIDISDMDWGASDGGLGGNDR